MTIEKKLQTLQKIAKIFHQANLHWQIGGSLLLYLKGITDDFADIDLLIAEQDVEKCKQLLSPLGACFPQQPSQQYKTKHFMEFVIDGVDFDIMAGLTIVYEGHDYYFPIEHEPLAELLFMKDIALPLGSLTRWLTYYTLMQRPKKVELLKSYFRFHAIESSTISSTESEHL